MFNIYKDQTGEPFAELKDKTLIINEVQDAVDILGNLGECGCNKVIIHESNLPESFFDLKTCLAGEILQKFSNYRAGIAIVGDFTKFRSKSLQDFIRECNRGKTVYFTNSLDSAIKRFSVK